MERGQHRGSDDLRIFWAVKSACSFIGVLLRANVFFFFCVAPRNYSPQGWRKTSRDVNSHSKGSIISFLFQAQRSRGIGWNRARLGSRTHINAETRRRRKKVNKRTAVTVRWQMSKIVSDDFSLVLFFFLLIPKLRLTRFSKSFSIPHRIVRDGQHTYEQHSTVTQILEAPSHTIQYSRHDHVPIHFIRRIFGSRISFPSYATHRTFTRQRDVLSLFFYRDNVRIIEIIVLTIPEDKSQLITGYVHWLYYILGRIRVVDVCDQRLRRLLHVNTSEFSFNARFHLVNIYINALL